MSVLNIISNFLIKNIIKNGERNISICASLNKEHRKNKRQNIVIKEDKVPQERSFEIGPAWIKQCDFPDEDTPNRLFNGVRFADLPTIYIRVSKNNTIYSLVDGKGKTVDNRSCGVEGFKNTKKGTNIAAQATAVTFSSRIKRKGFQQVRVAIKGLGPGRMSSIKGLEMGGLDIVSITDRTARIFRGPRPRKAKRL